MIHLGTFHYSLSHHPCVHVKVCKRPSTRQGRSRFMRRTLPEMTVIGVNDSISTVYHNPKSYLNLLHLLIIINNDNIKSNNMYTLAKT